MKAKSRYFTAESNEAAVAKAEEYFGCGRERIYFEEISDSEEGKPTELFAFVGTKAELSNMNAGFGIYYESDGVYLELYEARGAGMHLDSKALSQHLTRKSISACSDSAVQTLLHSHKGRVKIAPAQKEYIYGEDIIIEVPADELEARIELLEPEPGGPSLEFEAAKQKLLLAGISNGLDEMELKTVLYKKSYGGSHVVAVATTPVDGEDGVLTYHFQTDEKTAKPKELEGGKVDFRSLDLYVSVTEDQLLVSRTYATEGSPGMTVKGREIKQRPGKSVSLPKGKNVNVNTEKTEMYARTAGMVEILGGTVTVLNVYKIDGDVDLGVGNIDFDGSVHINGNVRAGHVIKATGGVIVGGVVEASEIIAGGNVEVKRGMQGMDKGRIEAGGSISLLYIERGKAIAQGSITVDACIHSHIEAGVSLYAKGKRGSIIGGYAAAAEEIVANAIGSVSQVNTEVEVGVMAQKHARLSFLEREMERLNGEMTKLDQLDAYLRKSKEKLDAATYDKLYRSGAENRRIYTEQRQDYTAEIDEIQRDLQREAEGKVHVFDTAYAGARITIGTDTYKVNDDMQYATFKFSDGQVVFTPCEKRRGS